MNQSRRIRIRKLFQFAEFVCEAIHRDAPARSIPTICGDGLAEFERFRRLHRCASSRGWAASASHLWRRAKMMADVVRQTVDQAATELAALDELRTSSVNDVARDLISLDVDFDDLEINRAEQTVTVTTDAIELEGIYLGRFEIRLDLRVSGGNHAYRVIATDPQPACSCDSTTHPHVQSETLCEGEGGVAIQRALDEGRLYDFFTIVSQILKTYNPHSAYVTTRDWEGVSCGDCGDSISSDESRGCGKCDASLCSECRSYCEGCEQDFCGECSSECAGCETNYCGSCLSGCDRCHEEFCEDCLTKGKCDDCIEQEKASAIESEQTEPTVHADSLGEATVPT